jgi:hypothetical protein
MSRKPNDPAPFLARPHDQRLDMALRSTGFDGARQVAPPIQTSSFTGGRASNEAAIDLARRDWILGVMERQRQVSPVAAALMRCEDLSSEQFRDHFYAPSRPCVIAGTIAEWPALAKWTPDYLRAAVGDAPVEFQGGRDEAGDFELAKDRHKRVAPFSAYLDLIENSPGNDAYVTAYNSAANQTAFAPLMADIRPVPSLLGPGEGMLWVGPAGTFTPLHFDLTNNLLIQIVGRKRVHLVSPNQTRLMANRRHVFSDVHDLEDATCMARDPQAKDIRPYVVTLEPGDMLFIPVGWWHQVRSLDFSVMMTCTNFLWPNDGWQDFPSEQS